jgi:hypothetical protein
MTALLLALILVFSGNASVREPLSGYATFCAPTPTHCQNWGGDAHLGAVPTFHYGDEPYQVTVRHDARHTVVTVVSYCACGDRAGTPTVIDLSPAAFSDLAPLSAGVIEVTIVVEGPRMTLPPTDTLPSEPRRELHSRVL